MTNKVNWETCPRCLIRNKSQHNPYCKKCLDQLWVRRCRKCKLLKDFDAFYGKRTVCKSCIADHSVEITDLVKKDKLTPKELRKDAKLSLTYGIGLSDTTAEVCEICGQDSPLVIDHCHVTGKFRGMLCNSCNKGLGLFYDDPEFLKSAIEYLKRNEQ
jgi:hypothetical protein